MEETRHALGFCFSHLWVLEKTKFVGKKTEARMCVEASNTHFNGVSRCMDNPGCVNLVGAVHQGTAPRLDNEQKRFVFACGSVSFLPF
jgi:hypothetical protein